MPGILMRVKHNKKRNVGIIFTQLTEYITESLVEGNSLKAKKALDILRKHFRKNSELFREYKIFKVLLSSNVKSRPEALAAISEAAAGAKRLNNDTLRKEKSSLIRDINYTLDEENFYDRRINDYRAHATIQTLLNGWCSESASADLETVVSFKSYLVDHLTEEKESQDIDSMHDPEANSLTLRIMREKFENKFSNDLSNSQVNILRSYAFADSPKKVSEVCAGVKSSILKELAEFRGSCENKMLLSKIDIVESRVKELKTESLDDEQVSRYLTLTQLSNEICSGD